MVLDEQDMPKNNNVPPTPHTQQLSTRTVTRAQRKQINLKRMAHNVGRDKMR